MQHSFNVNVAKEYGIASAVILGTMEFWIEQNRANKRNFFEGKYWTYNSKRAMAELFPYLSERQVNYAVEKLIKEGLVLSGNFNENQYDRTLWFSITDKGYAILQNCKIEITDLSNQYQFKPVNNISIIDTDDKESRLRAQAQARFFELYPEVIVDNYDAGRLNALTAEDWEKITEQFNGSAWLRDKVRTLSKLCKMATRIIAGEFAPFDSTSEEERKRREKEFDDL